MIFWRATGPTRLGLRSSRRICRTLSKRFLEHLRSFSQHTGSRLEHSRMPLHNFFSTGTFTFISLAFRFSTGTFTIFSSAYRFSTGTFTIIESAYRFSTGTFHDLLISIPLLDWNLHENLVSIPLLDTHAHTHTYILPTHADANVRTIRGAREHTRTRTYTHTRTYSVRLQNANKK